MIVSVNEFSRITIKLQIVQIFALFSNSGHLRQQKSLYKKWNHFDINFQIYNHILKKFKILRSFCYSLYFW